MTKLQIIYVTIISVIPTFQCQINQWIEETGLNGEDIWRSTSDFIPIQSQSFGSIKLGQIMSMEFDFIWNGRTNNPRIHYYEMFFRIGHSAKFGKGCDGQGSRYPSFWLTNFANTMHVSTSSGTRCQPSQSLSNYGIITIGILYHIKITFDNTHLVVDITGGNKPDWSETWLRNPTQTQYIGKRVPVWWMSNSYDDIPYNIGNGTFSNIIIVSNIFTTISTINTTIVPSNDPTTIPTDFTTNIPTIVPSETPTITPAVDSTYNPTLNPIKSSNIPTYIPTNIRTVLPSQQPSFIQSETPTVTPSFITSFSTTEDTPTNIPTKNPTIFPTNIPTSLPSETPIITPSFISTYIPTLNPTKSNIPTYIPTNVRTVLPSRQPSLIQSETPTVTPSFIISFSPTEGSMNPTTHPIFENTISENTLQPTDKLIMYMNNNKNNSIINTDVITLCIIVIVFICCCFIMILFVIIQRKLVTQMQQTKLKTIKQNKSMDIVNNNRTHNDKEIWMKYVDENKNIIDINENQRVINNGMSTSQTGSSIISELETVLHLKETNNHRMYISTNNMINHELSDTDNIEEEKLEEESSDISPLEQIFQYNKINNNYVDEIRTVQMQGFRKRDTHMKKKGTSNHNQLYINDHITLYHE